MKVEKIPFIPFERKSSLDYDIIDAFVRYAKDNPEKLVCDITTDTHDGSMFSKEKFKVTILKLTIK